MTLDLDPTAPPLTVAQAAPVLAVSPDTVYDAVARGEIRALHLGRAIRIPRAEIARLLGLQHDVGAGCLPAPTVSADPPVRVAGESRAG